jgi:hypothetical protein
MIKEIVARNASCNAVVGLVDQGSGLPAGRLGIFNDASNVLAWATFSNPAYMPAVDGRAIGFPISNAVVLTDGTASWFGVYDRDSTGLWSGSITDTSGAGDLRLNSVVLLTDQTVEIASSYFEVPA